MKRNKTALTLSTLISAGLVSSSAFAGERIARYGMNEGAYRGAIVNTARGMLSSRPHLDSDAAFVMRVFDSLGIRADTHARNMWQAAQRQSRIKGTSTPRAGDLAYFDNTWDLNRNGRVDDVLTHVAIVTGVRSDGTITMIHYGPEGVSELFANPRHPTKMFVNGRRVNHGMNYPGYLPEATRLYAGGKLRGFSAPYAQKQMSRPDTMVGQRRGPTANRAPFNRRLADRKATSRRGTPAVIPISTRPAHDNGRAKKADKRRGRQYGKKTYERRGKKANRRGNRADRRDRDHRRSDYPTGAKGRRAPPPPSC